MSVDKVSKSEQNKERNPHAGHRERMRKRFLENGLDGFSEHEILEFLLFYVHRRANTNEIGHDLLQTFGSLKGVLDADYEALLRVKGVGEQGAVLIKMIPQLFAAYQNSGAKKRRLSTVEEQSAFFMTRLMYEPDEVVVLACMDDRMQMLHCTEIARGIPNQVNISLQKLMRITLQIRCTAVFLAHNHPGGRAVPSFEDVRTTNLISRALHEVGVALLDHFIVADGKVISMKQSGGFTPV